MITIINMANIFRLKNEDKIYSGKHKAEYRSTHATNIFQLINGVIYLILVSLQVDQIGYQHKLLFSQAQKDLAMEKN